MPRPARRESFGFFSLPPAQPVKSLIIGDLVRDDESVISNDRDLNHVVPIRLRQRFRVLQNKVCSSCGPRKPQQVFRTADRKRVGNVPQRDVRRRLASGPGKIASHKKLAAIGGQTQRNTGQGWWIGYAESAAQCHPVRAIPFSYARK